MKVVHTKIFFTICIVVVAVLLYVGYVQYQEHRRIDSLAFSTTQVWDEAIYAEKDEFAPFLGRDMLMLTLPEAPANRSANTQAELAYLHTLAAARTEAQIAEIQQELQLQTTHFNQQSYAQLLAEKVQTQLLIETILPEFSALVLAHKEHFDRVRPSVLDETLSTVIAVPGHPSYPSGHAAQSMLIALLLGVVDPAHAETYKTDAVRIAHNREIAGVHYPSDSAAGRALAEAYFALLKENIDFVQMVEAAKMEW